MAGPGNPFLWNAGSSNNGLLVTLITLMTTELESLTNTSVIVSSVGGASGVFKNTNTGQGLYGFVGFNVGNPTLGGSAVAGANLTGWWLQSGDAYATSNFAEVNNAAPPRSPDWAVPVPASTPATGQFFWSPRIIVPTMQFKVLAQNNLGQTIGNGLTTVPQLVLAVITPIY